MAKDATKTLPTHHTASLPPQHIVDLFKVCFDPELYKNEQDVLSAAIQSVKTDLYNRDYPAAFNSFEKRTAYCTRWSPSRAIAYASLFSQLRPVREVIKCEKESSSSSNVLCVGGGAGGELIGIASIFTPSIDFNAKYATTKSAVQSKRLTVKLVDIADWSAVVDRLKGTMRDVWLFDHSSDLDVQSLNLNVLKTGASDLGVPSLDLITLLFTTNELFMEDKAGSIRFFQMLNKECSSGCYLLIAESAGSYSHITVGTKKFPIQFLIDTLLLGKRGEESEGQWELVDQNDSIWYRAKDDMDYPLKVENMRFFYRLYRKK
ncbi:25S rRNA (uracil2843-N3)-methyltransferase [Lachancea thermotolerans CBS 6340]|uniref:KLTH0G18700p n=1 Tax=Lachancea thermotolerans (strain ATCC 56472 / CBS 6340 / NRRL Y-8284) TaxID=559295 RepID=C5DNP1_LACTC|nr:KLTH0G18700p [Lachancea thermotolerans CBS 6340]CAR25402.1 KLTH0G18700p [Lachancea thermotolerans CBS 6340]